MISGEKQKKSHGHEMDVKRLDSVGVTVNDSSYQRNSLNLWSISSYRLRIALALALALSIEGLMRSNINMAMVCMVNETALAMLTVPEASIPTPLVFEKPMMNSTKQQIALLQEIGNTLSKVPFDSNGECNSKNFTKRQKKQYAGDLIITKSDQALIFTAFYAGGLAIVMPGSYLCDVFGASNLVFYGAVFNVVGTFATPFIARSMDSWALVLLRFLMGCGQGILVPCMNVLITYWFPLSEKSTAIAIATTGNQISVIVAMFLTAELCQFTWLSGWASAFYAYGIIGIVFCVIWICYVFDTPADAKNIDERELKYIRVGEAAYQCGANCKNGSKAVPWRKILGSLVVWSTALSSFSQNFMNVGTVIYLPTYYQNVLGMDLSSNGLMSALPFIFQLITKIIFATIADYLKSRRIMSHSGVVKLFNLIGSIGAGVCFILLSFCDCTQTTLAIILAVTAVGISSGFIPGYNTSIVCIAPRYTASVAAFSRLLGQIASVASPCMIGIVVVKGVREEWQLAFFIMAFILISTGLLFQCCGSASVQEWAIMPPTVTLESGGAEEYKQALALIVEEDEEPTNVNVKGGKKLENDDRTSSEQKTVESPP